MISLRGFAFGIAVATAVSAGTVVVGSAAASAATCPTLNRGTGRVSPAPAPGVDWSECDLAQANLGVRSGGITGVPASLPAGVLGATSLVDGYLVGPDVDLNGADLASADLKGVSFQRATLDNADLADADLTGASVDGYPPA
jgi:uncharacterized protein YjbI with pentapeptide repeats